MKKIVGLFFILTLISSCDISYKEQIIGKWVMNDKDTIVFTDTHIKFKDEELMNYFISKDSILEVTENGKTILAHDILKLNKDSMILKEVLWTHDTTYYKRVK